MGHPERRAVLHPRHPADGPRPPQQRRDVRIWGRRFCADVVRRGAACVGGEGDGGGGGVTAAFSALPHRSKDAKAATPAT